MLLITVLIIALVMAIAVPIVVYMQRTATRMTTITQQRERASGAIQDALAYASNVLTSTITWQAALSGRCPEEFGNDADPQIFSGASGGRYAIRCVPGNTPIEGEVRLVVTAFAAGAEGPKTPLRTVAARLAPRSMGLDVGGPLSQTAVAALLMHLPEGPGDLQVHWGPIACYDSQTWMLHGPIDGDRYPRKYSQGLICGEQVKRCDKGQETDGREFFGRTSLGFPPIVNETSYRASSEQTTDVRPPFSGASLPTEIMLEALPEKSGHFQLIHDQAVWQGGLAGYALHQSGAVLYIDGDAVLKQATFDMPKGAFIVRGDLTLMPGNMRDGIPMMNIHLPAQTTREYPYEPVSRTFPCHDHLGTDCFLEDRAHLHAFVYVKGDLILAEPSADTENVWVIYGALRVDGTIHLPPRTRLAVYFDESVAARVRTVGTAVAPVAVEEMGGS